MEGLLCQKAEPREKAAFLVDFAGKFPYKVTNAREGKSFSRRIDDGQEESKESQGSIRETHGKVSNAFRCAVPFQLEFARVGA